jgi:phosphopantothenoylcysteine synthetase/decarboxylase
MSETMTRPRINESDIGANEGVIANADIEVTKDLVQQVMLACPDVVVTAGGTQEKIDDVRYIGNFSGGKFGISIAEAYAERGYRVLLLAPNAVVERYGLPKGVEHQSFTSAESLKKRMLSIPATRLVLHAAAVSDYSPEQTEGKISSDEEELIIRLKRTPKILPLLRDHFGEATRIVGFKLLSNVTEEQLVAAALKQMYSCRTNACVANDLQDIGEKRKVHIVKPNGQYQTLYGDTKWVAQEVAFNTYVPEAYYD